MTHPPHTNPLAGLHPPANLDWPSWVRRWDRMQQRYLVQRTERFELIARLIVRTQPATPCVVDLGCGTGSLMLAVLTAIPGATVHGLDFDPTLLWLAQARLEPFGTRSRLDLADLRDPNWTRAIPAPVDAVISATALHWLTPDQLATLYHQIAQILKPDGLLLNADHVASPSPAIQQEWERHRDETLQREREAGQLREREGEDTPPPDDWDQFWTAYSEALGLDVAKVHHRVLGGWQGGVEAGLPLPWHLDRLRENHFTHVDCFWRSDTDAVYGGIRK